MKLHPLHPYAFIAGLLLVVCSCLCSVWACGCSSATGAARAAEYGAALDACVETATTIEQSRACRADVARSFGRDAGSAFVRVVAFDNGHPSTLDASAVDAAPPSPAPAPAVSPASPVPPPPRDDPLDAGRDAP